MNIALWIVAGVLAAAFLFAGTFKAVQGRKIVDKGMGWAEDYSDRTVRLIGVAEVLGALGLILPAVTGIATWLVPVAALGLAIIMTGAARRHILRKEPLVPNVVLGALALFVAVGRAFIEPFGG